MTARRLARMIEDVGATVLGPAPSVQKALELLDSQHCDAALLDINLGNETVQRVAERLENEGCPYVFVSGYASPKTLLDDPRFKAKRLISKPVEPLVLREVVKGFLNRL
jgi:CheY-like chemotaxis protein